MLREDSPPRIICAAEQRKRGVVILFFRRHRRFMLASEHQRHASLYVGLVFGLSLDQDGVESFKQRGVAGRCPCRRSNRAQPRRAA